MPKKVLLCVDDERANLQIRKMLLEREGYEVLTAGDGDTGLDIFDKQSVDLVILDYRMPEPNGGIVANRMRASHPDVPIIMLSAYLHPPEEVNGVVDAYITKGEHPRLLLDRIRELLKPT